MEGREAVGRLMRAPYGWQDYRGYKCHAANPHQNGDDMYNPCECEIIHHVPLHLCEIDNHQ